MDFFALNGTSLDGGTVTNSFVVGPATTATLSIVSAERILQFLPATTTYLSIDSAGSASKVSPLGAQSVSMSVVSAGTLYNLSPLTSPGVTMTVASSGTLIMTGGLTGSALVSIDSIGGPRSVVYFGAQVIATGVEITGLLTNKQYLSAADTMSVTVSGDPRLLGRLSGNLSMSIDSYGVVAVNPADTDPPQYTMYVPYIERTLVVQ